jgi:hypothetical protein
VSGRLNIAWEPPGPVSQAFMASEAPVQVLNGPVGSGKTTTALMKCTRLAALQWPSRIHQARNSRGGLVPVRQFRACVVRDTYRQLWRSTLLSWFARVPQDVGTFTGSLNAPATHRINFELPDGSLVDFQADFVAIGDDSAEEVLRGYEPTIFYLNELDTLPFEVYVYASGRTGRFPPVADCGSRFHGILVDCNAPILNSECYTAFFKPSPLELKEAGIAVFRQPGGRSPGAENLKNLPADYYTRQVKLNATRAWYVARMVDNKAGFSREGKPVYGAEYNDALHVAAEPLEFMPGIALQIGLDAGLNPAAILCQRLPNGQWRVIDELVGETGTGAIRFGGDLARRLKERFPLARTIIGWADPSAEYGADKKAGEKNWMQIVAARAAITIRPAPTNKLIPRLEAVRLPLTRLIDGQPGFLLSPVCTRLREGFNATYRYKKVRPNEEVYHEEPEKNEASHPHDGLQYALLGGGEHTAVHERHRDRDQAVRQARHEHDWNPLAQGAP